MKSIVWMTKSWDQLLGPGSKTNFSDRQKRAAVKKQDRINKNSADNANDAKEELLIQFLIDCSGMDFSFADYFGI